MPHEIILAIKDKTCKSDGDQRVLSNDQRQVLVAVTANNIIIAMETKSPGVIVG